MELKFCKKCSAKYQLQCDDCRPKKDQESSKYIGAVYDNISDWEPPKPRPYTVYLLMLLCFLGFLSVATYYALYPNS